MTEAVQDAVAAYLGDHPGSTAREISAALGVDKSLVNRLLYRERDLFVNLGGNPPQWAVDADHSTPEPDTRVSRSVDRGGPAGGLYAWQQEALKAWRANGRRGIVEAVTGAGKTRLALAAVEDALARRERVAILVPTVELVRQWRAELETAFPDVSLGLLGDGGHDTLQSVQVLVATASSAGRYYLGLPAESPGLLIADECHRYGAKQTSLGLEEAFGARLGLSATYARMDGAHLTVLEPYFGGVVYELGYERAIADRVVASVRVASIGVDFAPAEQAEWDLRSEQYRKARSRLIAGFGAPAEPFGEFMAFVNRLRQSGTRSEGIAAGRFWSAYTQRKQLLSATGSKQRAVVQIVPAILDADRVLVFTATIAAAEKAAKVLASSGVQVAAYHSELSPSERRERMAQFSAGKLRVLATAEVLDEGVNVPAADLAIILASTQQRRQMVQRMGRVLRKKEDGRPARFVLVYVRGTSEDPGLGAHEAFFDEILDVADEVGTFGPEASPEEIRTFLAPGRR